MTCKNCGSNLKDGATFCPNCGNKVEDNQANKNKQKESSSKNKTIYIVIIVVLIILSFVAGFLIGKSQNNQSEISKTVTKDKDQSNEKTKEKEEVEEPEEYTFNMFNPSKISNNAVDSEETTKKIEIYNLFFNPKNVDYGKTRYVYIYGKNGNSQAVNVKVTFEYYDKEGYRIQKETTFDNMVSANKEFVLRASVPNDSLGYSDIKLFYEAKPIKTYEKEIALEKIEYSHNKLKDENISVLIKNNSDKKISSIHFACLYYKDGKVVFAQESTSTGMEANQSDTISFYSYMLKLNNDYKNPKKIEYDNYKVFPFAAKYSDSTNY